MPPFDTVHGLCSFIGAYKVLGRVLAKCSQLIFLLDGPAAGQQSLMPDVDSTLQTIAKWKYIIVTDLTKAFHQTPLPKSSIKYCGVAIPFRGTRFYTRSAMGMPGSETALEEMMCRILGDNLQDGTVAKLADDLYCCGNRTDELSTVNVSCKPFICVMYAYHRLKQLSAPDRQLFWERSGQKEVY